MRSSVSALVKVNAHPDFILILGDSSAHCQPNWEATTLAIEQASTKLLEAFPSTPVFPVLGIFGVPSH